VPKQEKIHKCLKRKKNNTRYFRGKKVFVINYIMIQIAKIIGREMAILGLISIGVICAASIL